jgi:hypothetical protein
VKRLRRKPIKVMMIMILLFVFTFVQGIYYISVTKYVSRVQNVAANLYLQSMVYVMLFNMLNVLFFLY